jgi:5-methylcytosine-specific restriction protein A
VSDSDDVVDLLAKARSKLGLTANLLAVERTASSSARYTLITSRGSVDLGTKRWMTHQAEFNASICDAIGQMPKTCSRQDWKEVCELLRAVSLPIDLGTDATDDGLGREWLRDYLSDSPKADLDKGSLYSKQPVWHDGELLIHIVDVRTFVEHHYGDKVNHGRMASILRAAGCRPRSIDVVIAGERLQQARWIVSDDLTPLRVNEARAQSPSAREVVRVVRDDTSPQVNDVSLPDNPDHYRPGRWSGSSGLGSPYLANPLHTINESTLSKPCLDCGVISPKTRCPECTVVYDARVNHRRGSSTDRGYDAAWQRLSRRARRMQPYCTDCGDTTIQNLTGDHLRWPAMSLADVDVVCLVCNIKRGARRKMPTPG